MLQNYIGQNLYNQAATKIGSITGLEKVNGEQCFVVDGSNSSGKYWQVSRLNNDVWVGKTLNDVLDAIIVNAEKISDPIKRQALLGLNKDAVNR